MTGDPERRDECPICKTRVEPLGALGQGQMGEGEVNPEPWEEVATCPNCNARLRRGRDSDDPWTATAA